MVRKLDDKLTREFKANLKRILDENKGIWNAKKLSVTAGLGETAVRDILQDRSASPKLETVHKLANALGVGLYELMPSLISSSYDEIQSLRRENQELREALDNTYATMEDSLRAARARSFKTKK